MNKEINIPIIMVHRGNQKYLKETIQCAEKHGNKVILAGDETNEKYAEHWVNQEDIEGIEYKEFLKYYRHFSPNSEEYELICFERWFYMYEIMKKYNLKEAIMQDSDNLLFRTYTGKDFQECDVALCWQEKQSEFAWCVSAHFSYWKIEVLKEFLDYVLDVYKNNITIFQDKIESHKRRYAETGEYGGGICDMTLLYLWEKATKYRTINLCKLCNNTIYDRAINVEKINDINFKYIKSLGIKRVIFKNKTPHFIDDKNGNLIKAPIIQAQGSTKMYIPLWKRKINCMIPYFALGIIAKILRKE